MLEQEIYEQYGIHLLQQINDNRYPTFYDQSYQYHIVYADNVEQNELLELKQLGDYMAQFRDLQVASLVPTRNHQFVGLLNERPVLLYRSKLQRKRNDSPEWLASFHRKSHQLQLTESSLNRYGKWNELWAKRLDQLETWWIQRLQAGPLEQEKLFIESYPYFKGRTENAIQYAVDTRLDTRKSELDRHTICFNRFGANQEGNLPIEWVIDHPARDVSEWVRLTLVEKEENWHEKVRDFLYRYHSKLPMSVAGWRFTYARLLFPLHYFEAVEGYYSSQSQEENEYFFNKLASIIENRKKEEHFFKTFFSSIGIDERQFHLPRIQWLA
jgi:spore coat protein YutH